MKKMILIGLSIVVAILTGFATNAAFKPEDYLIQREVTIEAKPEAVYQYLVSMKNADKWMPWKESDPHVKNTYSGPEEGVGAVSSWESPGPMGTGMAIVVDAVPNQSVKTKITYTKPMTMSQDSEFLLSPMGEDTKMTWVVQGKQPFFARFISTLIFMDMDKYVGGMFEKGLSNLKNLVETKSAS